LKSRARVIEATKNARRHRHIKQLLKQCRSEQYACFRQSNDRL